MTISAEAPAILGANIVGLDGLSGNRSLYGHGMDIGAVSQ